MKRLLICCAVGVGLVFALAPTVVPTPASAYHYRGHYYPYRYHGHYYGYRHHGHYYSHRRYYRHHYRYW